MKGRPDSDYPGQQVDYVKLNRKGQYYDINGNIVGKKSQEAHIPLNGNEEVIKNLIKRIWE
jgi:hypothetical protein